MTQKLETTTEQPLSAPKYKVATVFGEALSVNTALVPPTGRMVVTTATDGTVVLLYTPREQPLLTGKTST